jgi:alpha-L-glutamate ligase-like protein
MKASKILGLNARTRLFSYLYNKPQGKKIARSKILTKRVLKRVGIPVPETYAKFRDPTDIFGFNWNKLPSSFALKPSKGLGGEGIVIVKRKAKPEEKLKKDGLAWLTTQRRMVTVKDLELHIIDILEGAYSPRNVPDLAFIEEYVGRHKAFRKYAYRGTPDIRVIVFNKVPVVAMLRLPTKKSGGRANLHQGAIAVGIDIATGITTRAFWKGKYIRHKPGTKRKLHGIKIPSWTRVLEIAVQCQEATGLGYLGADIVLHPEKGPVVLEVNYQPGLIIQLANRAGLRKRLERVEDLRVRDEEHGVKIGKALFAARFADRVKAKDGNISIGTWEKVKLLSKDKKKLEIRAKVDTGAWRSSIDRTLAGDLGLLEENNILWTKVYKSGIGKQKRQVINVTFYLAGRKIKTIASVADRSKLRTPLIIGRKDLTGFSVNPKGGRK